nr:hypothetical protein Itr_chr06CG18160 [Ipomoea trifida]
MNSHGKRVALQRQTLRQRRQRSTTYDCLLPGEPSKQVRVAAISSPFSFSRDAAMASVSGELRSGELSSTTLRDGGRKVSLKASSWQQ